MPRLRRFAKNANKPPVSQRWLGPGSGTSEMVKFVPTKKPSNVVRTISSLTTSPVWTNTLVKGEAPPVPVSREYGLLRLYTSVPESRPLETRTFFTYKFHWLARAGNKSSIQTLPVTLMMPVIGLVQVTFAAWLYGSENWSWVCTMTSPRLQSIFDGRMDALNQNPRQLLHCAYPGCDTNAPPGSVELDIWGSIVLSLLRDHGPFGFAVSLQFEFRSQIVAANAGVDKVDAAKIEIIKARIQYRMLFSVGMTMPFRYLGELQVTQTANHFSLEWRQPIRASLIVYWGGALK
jgi:hypothetical protein